MGRMETLALCMNFAHHPQLRPKLISAAITKPLVRLLDDDAKLCRERSAGVLANLMNGHSEMARAVFSQSGSDVVRRLLSLLEKDHSGTSRRYAAQALAMLTTLELPRRVAHKTNA